ncbi:MAG: alpha/beta hydrolase [Propionibacteriaceae bacterium]|jgi:pimeloyl-ACP methyl ester carboxylesterase|nr:alpha/beta hydrolase [Propionibacteriaceae bacterium]
MPAPLTVHHHGDPAHPPLVLLHGLTDAGTVWPDAVRRWQDDWHIIAPDLRGHGSSPRFTADEVERVCETWFDDVVALLDDVTDGGRAPAVVVGHSLGGYLTLRAAIARPDLVRAIVMEDPAGSMPVEHVQAFQVGQGEFINKFDTPEKAAAEICRMSHETPWLNEEILVWAACKPLVDRRVLEHLALADVDIDSSDGLPQVPALLVLPEGRTLIPRYENFPRDRVQIEHIPHVGHCIRRDDREAYHCVVDPFLQAHHGDGA